MTKGKPNNLLVKKIEPCKVVHKFGPNIFNVSNLFPYKAPWGTDVDDKATNEEDDVEWVKDFPSNKPIQLESILETRVIQKTRGGTYKDYLV